MPNYAWKGRTRAGKVQEGVLVAENKEAVVAALRKQQIMVTATGRFPTPSSGPCSPTSRSHRTRTAARTGARSCSGWARTRWSAGWGDDDAA